MAATVKIQPQGFSVQYPKTSWRVIFVEHSSGKFYFRLSSEDFWFEPRDRYRYPSHDDAFASCSLLSGTDEAIRALKKETEHSCSRLVSSSFPKKHTAVVSLG